MNSSGNELKQNGGDTAITIEDLHVRRGAQPVISGISCSVRAGIVTGLLGPSGSGKTTLIRSIIGVQIIQKGEVTVLGKSAGSPSLRRRVAYVTQAPSIYSDLTVEENLRYFARILDVPPARISDVIATVRLKDQTKQITRTLSGGERGRVSLAVALLGKPELLVLDEPTVGVDPILRRELWQTFHDLAARGVTMLVSSHVMDEAARCHHLILMRNGQIVATGTPAELLERTHTTDLEDAFIALAQAA
jgi:ABC-2 type transport system ATP-binding protein